MSAKAIFIRDKQAVALVNERAAREHRNTSNAAMVTIIEALGGNHKAPPLPPDLTAIEGRTAQDTDRALGSLSPNSEMGT